MSENQHPHHDNSTADLGPTMAVPDFLDAVATSLDARGLTADRTLAAVAICRDELTQTMVAEVQLRWGAPFALSGLGGLPALGTTGWGACLSHVPEQHGRGHLLVIGLPHIGVAPDGTIGASLRRSQDRPTTSCGALAAVLAAMTTDATDGAAPAAASAGLADAEFERLAAAVGNVVGSEGDGSRADLLQLTHAAAQAQRSEIWADLDALDPWGRMDATFVSGIQVHMDDLTNRVIPLGAEVRVDGAPVESIDLGIPTA